MNLDEAKLAIAEKLSFECPSTSCGPAWSDRPEDIGKALFGDVALPCEVCHGEGRVYPLKEECRWEILHASFAKGETKYDNRAYCDTCQGRGWVPSDMHLEDLMAAAAKCGVGVFINNHDVSARSTSGLWATRSIAPATNPDEIKLAAMQAILEVL